MRFDVWFALKQFVVTKLERGGIDREGLVEGHKDIVAARNSGDGAEDDGFLAVFSDASAGTVWEETFTRGEDAAVVADKVANNWWHDAVMHVAGDEEIELIEIASDFGIFKENWRVNQGDFSFVFWQILDEFVIELMQIVKHNALILAARMEESSAMVFVLIELEILW